MWDEDASMGRIEGLGPKRAPRLHRSEAEKRRIVELSLQPRMSVARAAQTAGVKANQVLVLQEQPFSGRLFVFRGRRGDKITLLWYDGDGLCLFAKRLERGRFIWPQASEGAVSLTRAQLSMLIEGIDWRRPERTWTPQVAV
jgi:transposase